jgi:hypothetical protein
LSIQQELVEVLVHSVKGLVDKLLLREFLHSEAPFFG